MNRGKLLRHIVFLMFFIFFLYVANFKFHWDYSISWFDELMHLLAGFWIGLFFIYFFSRKNPASSSILTVLFWVLFVGILWEFFEYFLIVISHDSFNLVDTLSDILFDLAGGYLALIFCYNRTNAKHS